MVFPRTHSLRRACSIYVHCRRGDWRRGAWRHETRAGTTSTRPRPPPRYHPPKDPAYFLRAPAGRHSMRALHVCRSHEAHKQGQAQGAVPKGGERVASLAPPHSPSASPGREEKRGEIKNILAHRSSLNTPRCLSELLFSVPVRALAVHPLHAPAGQCNYSTHHATGAHG
jgi:hypothetical protein